MAFRNPPIAGLYLVRPALRSPNYIQGSQGWTVNRDGTVEFNSGLFRGTLSAGNDPGQHVVFANPVTGDAFDVYDSANHLVFAITNQGLAANYATGTTPEPSVGFQNAELVFSDNALPTAHQATMSFSPSAVPAAQGQVTILNSDFVGDVGAIEVLSGSADGTKRSTVTAVERGHSGSVMVSDNVSTNNLVHVGLYNIATDPGGGSVFSHGCPFTPTAGFLAGVNGIGASFPYQYAWFPAPFTSGTAHAAFKDNVGASLVSTTLGVFGVFYG